MVLAIPGVQRYIAESRRTGDLVSASTQVAALSAAAVSELHALEGVEVVFPAEASSQGGLDYGGVPNRVVARVIPGMGEDVARRAADAVRSQWASWVREVYPEDTPQVLGFPDPQWVMVPAAAGGYSEQFVLAQSALAARRRLRSFGQPLVNGRHLCSLSARWPVHTPPSGAPRHQRDEKLSVVNWVKRRAPQSARAPRTPSTYSIASAPYRAEVLQRLGDPTVLRCCQALYAQARPLEVREAPVAGLAAPGPAAGLAVPGPAAAIGELAAWLRTSAGPWVHPDRWNDLTVAQALAEGQADRGQGQARQVDVRKGRQAAHDLSEAMGRLPGTHLAVIVQDLDGMGKFMREDPSPQRHRRVSGLLSTIAREQVALARGQVDGVWVHGVPVYAGGDDLLVLAPAASALVLARAVHDVVPADDLPTASSAVLFFSQGASLRRAVSSAAELLEQAKSLDGKHGLAVGYQRRSGTRHVTVQPWVPPDGRTRAAELFEALSRAGGYDLSPRLVFDLERDVGELNGLLHADPGLLDAEVARLVRRHLGGPVAARSADATDRRQVVHKVRDFIVDLGRSERGRRDNFNPVPAARVGVFLRQEAR
ncbi:MAG: hypothetical protein JXA67_15440 [Micromonosporaceae bacterium]|nr:hypothetical protein [Micromonosporaceae bacterium]